MYWLILHNYLTTFILQFFILNVFKFKINGVMGAGGVVQGKEECLDPRVSC